MSTPQADWVLSHFPGNYSGTFLEIGANDGITDSNCHEMESRLGWSGICIEGNPRCVAALQQNRKAVIISTCLAKKFSIEKFNCVGSDGCDGLSGLVGRSLCNKFIRSNVIIVPTVPLNFVLEWICAPSEFDYLSVDVEDAEHEIFSCFPFSEYRFRFITIERVTNGLDALLQHNGYQCAKQIGEDYCYYDSILSFGPIAFKRVLE